MVSNNSRRPLRDIRSALRPPPAEQHQNGAIHRDLRGGGFRAAIFGLSDGLVSNVSLILGTAGAHPGHGIVRLAGLAGLVGGALSMSTGEYVSMAGQREAMQRELDVERTELAESPIEERDELAAIFRERGVTAEVAARLAEELMVDPETALLTHAREELGIDPTQMGSPLQAAGSSFVTFAIGAFIPLIAFLRGSSDNATILVAIVLTGIAALTIGALLSHFTSRSPLFSATRSLLICAIAGGATYGIGTLIGISAG